jgi:hypothetical protein
LTPPAWYRNSSGSGPVRLRVSTKHAIGPEALSCSPEPTDGTYPYGMGRPRDDRDAAQDLARELADLADQLASLKGEANTWLVDESYDALRHRLENAHASVEAAAVEARRRVRLNEGRE